MTVNVLTLKFANTLKAHEVPLFRGAVIALLSDKHVLFHNHEGDSFRYAYPLIQYKVVGGKAAMVCVGDGANAVGELFAGGNLTVTMGDRTEQLVLEHVEPRRCNVQVWESSFGYRLRRWLPLNGENYRRYAACESLAERCALLEGILRGNILSMGKGLGIRFDRQVVCSITRLRDPYRVTVKGVKVMAFDVEFRCNVSLPPLAGLGKHASLNCGTVTRLRQPDENKQETEQQR